MSTNFETKNIKHWNLRKNKNLILRSELILIFNKSPTVKGVKTAIPRTNAPPQQFGIIKTKNFSATSLCYPLKFFDFFFNYQTQTKTKKLNN